MFALQNFTVSRVLKVPGLPKMPKVNDSNLFGSLNS
jgi:hypothetical protein